MCSVSRQSPPALPDEILHEIFSIATHVEGHLVSPHWRVEDPYIPWVISLETRRSIPLVCRQWHAVGLEYLYQHIVIFNLPQLEILSRVIDYTWKDPEMRAERLGWIRGLEFVALRVEIGENNFTSFACTLIRNLPQRRLRVFGFEDGACCAGTSTNTKIVAEALAAAAGSLEILHMPCTIASKDTDSSIYDALYSIFYLDARDHTGLSKLHTISFTSGRWESCHGSWRNSNQRVMISFLAHNIPSIRTVYLNWLREEEVSGVHLPFLRAALQLQTIHLIVGGTPLLQQDLDDFLDAVPQLQRLVITPHGGFNYARELTRDVVTHKSLEEIVLILDLSSGPKSILFATPIVSKLRSGHLPELKRVIVHGAFLEGCVDLRGVLAKRHADCWKDAIETCAKQKVDLVDQHGNPIHIWSMRHGIKFVSGETDSESENPSSEGGWWENSNSSGFMGYESGDDDTISNDSEDSPYRYVSQPDLDYDSDSDE